MSYRRQMREGLNACAERDQDEAAIRAGIEAFCEEATRELGFARIFYSGDTIRAKAGSMELELGRITIADGMFSVGGDAKFARNTLETQLGYLARSPAFWRSALTLRSFVRPERMALAEACNRASGVRCAWLDHHTVEVLLVHRDAALRVLRGPLAPEAIDRVDPVVGFALAFGDRTARLWTPSTRDMFVARLDLRGADRPAFLIDHATRAEAHAALLAQIEALP